MDVHHHCTMTLRHLIARRPVNPRCAGMAHHGVQRHISGNLKTLLLHLNGTCHQHARQLSSASTRATCRAVKSPEVSAEPDKSSTASRDDPGTAERFGVATRQLNELADSAPQDVYKSQSSIISSAAQLAQLLDSSLTAGISESSAQMADRGSRLGKNRLPERDQVPALCLTAVQTPLQPALTPMLCFSSIVNVCMGRIKSALSGHVCIFYVVTAVPESLHGPYCRLTWKFDVQISFWELLGNTFEDFTIIVLVISGVLSIALEVAFGDSDHGWVEGAAILAAVAVVALVTALNDYEKEKQFRYLSALSSESQASISLSTAHASHIRKVALGAVIPAAVAVVALVTMLIDYEKESSSERQRANQLKPGRLLMLLQRLPDCNLLSWTAPYRKKFCS